METGQGDHAQVTKVPFGLGRSMGSSIPSQLASFIVSIKLEF